MKSTGAVVRSLLIGTGLVLALAVFASTGMTGILEKRTDVVKFGDQPLTLIGPEIKVGDVAPDFTALNNALEPVSLSDYEGKVRIITAFPSIDTPVCSMQTRRFNQEAAELHGVQILTVSADLPFALKRFCAVEGIDKAVTLSDYKDMEFGQKYGFMIEENRLLTRGTVIVDQAGVVRYVEYVSELNAEPDFDAAIAVARELSTTGKLSKAD